MERAERSEGLHKRSAEDWGRGLSGARGEAPLPCLFASFMRREVLVPASMAWICLEQ
jgi:hypothetical protein